MVGDHILYSVFLSNFEIEFLEQEYHLMRHRLASFFAYKYLNAKLSIKTMCEPQIFYYLDYILDIIVIYYDCL